jgi:hypothetical protein
LTLPTLVLLETSTYTPTALKRSDFDKCPVTQNLETPYNMSCINNRMAIGKNTSNGEDCKITITENSLALISQSFNGVFQGPFTGSEWIFFYRKFEPAYLNNKIIFTLSKYVGLTSSASIHFELIDLTRNFFDPNLTIKINSEGSISGIQDGYVNCAFRV